MILLPMSSILHATPEATDGSYWGWNTPSALGISATEGRKEISKFNHPDVMLEGNFPMYKIKLKSSNLVVGRIRYDAINGDISIYTFLPHAIPQERRNAVGEFFRKLNEDKEFSSSPFGHYYVNPNTGECGFVRRLTSPRQLHGNPSPSETASMELAEHWGNCCLYELYPEIQRILYSNVRLSHLIHTVKIFPPETRTRGKLTDMLLCDIPDHPSAPGSMKEHKLDVLTRTR